jgi:hypothetical protein
MNNQPHHLPLATLLEELQSQKSERRVTALRTIAHQHVTDAIPAVLEMMCTTTHDWVVELDEAERTLQHMGAIGRDALIHATFWEDPYCRAVFARALGAFPDVPSIARLIDLSGDSDFMVRVRCGEALARMGSAGVLPYITQAVEERERVPRARVALLIALYHIGDEQALEPIIVLLRDRQSWVRSGAVFALSRFAQERSYRLLLRMLKDRAVKVRCAAIRALARFPNPETIQAIEVLHTDPSATVRRVVNEVLEKLRLPPEE